MKVFGITGWSGSGKTTLLVRLIPALVARGLTVSTVKHAHHGFDVDRPGKDSYEHRRAGATEVLIGSANRWALMHELRGDAEPPLALLLGHMAPCDLVLVEGFKEGAFPKLEVWRAEPGPPTLWPRWPGITAIASDAAAPPALAAQRDAPAWLALADVAAIAAHVRAHAQSVCAAAARSGG